LFLNDLPSDPDGILRSALTWYKAWKNSPAEDDDAATVAQMKAFIVGIIRKYQLKIALEDFSGDFKFEEIFSEIEAYISKSEQQVAEVEIERIIETIGLEHDPESFGYAVLNASEKRRIHENIKKIRELLDSAELEKRKKNKLFSRINELATEVDKDGTSTDNFFAFLGDTAFVVGDMALKAKPFTDEVKDMIKTIGRARARKEGVSLPSGDEVFKLPAPDEEEKS